MSSSRSPSITTLVSWFGVRLTAAFLAGKYSRANPAPAGTRFAEAGSFVPFDKDMGYRVVDTLKQVAARHNVSPARAAFVVGAGPACGQQV